jgi:hypothetical protein
MYSTTPSPLLVAPRSAAPAAYVHGWRPRHRAHGGPARPPAPGRRAVRDHGAGTGLHAHRRRRARALLGLARLHLAPVRAGAARRRGGIAGGSGGSGVRPYTDGARGLAASGSGTRCSHARRRLRRRPQAALPADEAAAAHSLFAGDAARRDAPAELPPLPCAALLHGGATGSRRSAAGAARPQRADRCQIPDCASPSLAHLRPYNRRTRRVAALLRMCSKPSTEAAFGLCDSGCARRTSWQMPCG